MHLILLLSFLALACGLRWIWPGAVGSWYERWQQTLAGFLLPPLLLVTSAISVVWMGPHGQMIWVKEGWVSYGLAIAFLLLSIFLLIRLAWQGNRTLQQVRTYPFANFGHRAVRVIDTSAPCSAQIGFWQPELVISQGLLNTLTTEHLEAVFAHEQAHYHYRDTFWFFWLGWIRRITAWLPQTEAIWQELLVLRELRADRWALQQTDNLLLAEALLLVVQDSPAFSEHICAAFSSIVPPNRFAQRIEALLTEVDLEPIPEPNVRSWIWLLLSLLPLFSILFHA
jgi:Zn-dependent protease with chaperone function